MDWLKSVAWKQAFDVVFAECLIILGQCLCRMSGPWEMLLQNILFSPAKSLRGIFCSVGRWARCLVML